MSIIVLATAAYVIECTEGKKMTSAAAQNLEIFTAGTLIYQLKIALYFFFLFLLALIYSNFTSQDQIYFSF